MRAIALFSGGLDSTLAIKLILEQGIEVVALHFVTSFCTCNKKGCGFVSKKFAKAMQIDLITRFLGDEYLQIVKSPKYGYGKNLNPCIDCRILMFKKCKEVMQEIGASFVVTGEVLGQRPKSQFREALKIIERESELEGLVLRPLSAKLLDPTIPEEKGWVNREKLLDLYGRTRKPQIRLADAFDIKDYPCSAGGCLLTIPEFARKVKDLIDHEELNLSNAELLKIGRHFRLSKCVKLIVGRNEKENKHLLNLARKNDLLFFPLEVPGPTALVRGHFDDEIIGLSCNIICHYCDLNGGDCVNIVYKKPFEGEEKIFLAVPIGNDMLLRFKI